MAIVALLVVIVPVFLIGALFAGSEIARLFLLHLLLFRDHLLLPLHNTQRQRHLLTYSDDRVTVVKAPGSALNAHYALVFERA